MPSKRSPGPDHEAESRRILDRVEAESTTLGRSALERATQHLSGADAPQGDRIELWGRRIGRGLAVLFALWLVVTVLQHLSR